MALFGFSDISFNRNQGKERAGPLAPLQGKNSEFATTTLRYPLDIGNADKAHYMVFYIREQRNTSFKRGSLAADPSGKTSFDNTQAADKQLLSGLRKGVGPGGASVGQELLGKFNGALGQLNAQTNGALKGVTSVLGKAAATLAGSIDNIMGQAGITVSGNSPATSAHIDTSIKAITGGSLGLARTTKLTKDAIALYIPDTLNYTYSQGYEDVSIGGELGAKILAAGSSAFDELKKGNPGATIASILKSVGLESAKGITSAAGDKTGGQIFTAATGVVSNPMIEMIYKSPSFRSFNFEFTFYPRDEKEALEVQRIIERFRFHQAPELADGAKGFLIAPSEFDIKFYYAGSQNPNIPAIADSCVLKQIDVNYTPSGFTTYEVPGENKPSLGRTGMPVAIQLRLDFTETTFLTKADFKDDKGIQTINPVLK